MPVQEMLIGVGFDVQEVKAPDPETGEEKVVQRTLIFLDQTSGKTWVIPLDLRVAEDIGGRLKGEPPKKHIDIAPANGHVAPSVLAQRGHLGPGGIPRG